MAEKKRRSGKRSRPEAPVTFDTVRELALLLPGVEEGVSYGTPALRVKTKFLARLREDGDSVAFRMGFDERELLMKARPKVFFITEHYLRYPAVLLRLSTAGESDVAEAVRMAWRGVAPKRLIGELDSPD